MGSIEDKKKLKKEKMASLSLMTLTGIWFIRSLYLALLRWNIQISKLYLEDCFNFDRFWDFSTEFF